MQLIVTNEQSKLLFLPLQKYKSSKQVCDDLYLELQTNYAWAVGPPKLNGIVGPDPFISLIVP